MRPLSFCRTTCPQSRVFRFVFPVLLFCFSLFVLLLFSFLFMYSMRFLLLYALFVQTEKLVSFVRSNKLLRFSLKVEISFLRARNTFFRFSFF